MKRAWNRRLFLVLLALLVLNVGTLPLRGRAAAPERTVSQAGDESETGGGIIVIPIAKAGESFGWETGEVDDAEESDAGGVQSAQPAAETNAQQSGGFEIVMNFAGDVMIASMKNQTKALNFNDYASRMAPEYFLEKVRPYFEEDDFTVVNLENVLTDQDLPEKAKNYTPAFWFRSRTANTAILTSSSVEAVSLANNHTGDYGPQGLEDTIRAVSRAGLQYGTDDKVIYLEKQGFRIAVICHGLWNSGQTGTVAGKVREAAKQSDFQIVFYHGGTEGSHTPDGWRVTASRQLVDAGADLVLGNHPHVLQPMETYQGTEILYSLGNFCYGGSNYPENRTAIYRLRLKIGPNGAVAEKTGEIIPCYVYTGERNNYQPAPIENEAKKQKVLDFFAGKVPSPV